MIIRELKQTDAAAERRRSTGQQANFHSIDVRGRMNSLGLETF